MGFLPDASCLQNSKIHKNSDRNRRALRIGDSGKTNIWFWFWHSLLKHYFLNEWVCWVWGDGEVGAGLRGLEVQSIQKIIVFPICNSKQKPCLTISTYRGIQQTSAFSRIKDGMKCHLELFWFLSFSASLSVPPLSISLVLLLCWYPDHTSTFKLPSG